ncbi:MAG TPA: helix-turn-helix transcriptional regulator [bacterium]|nr:helix-turn-helix transcriptional regulator [bacterium]HQG47373.1 helix-turn-helix transcriptional regulator [bacterium]HQI48888.1 helix-turn-helix transcriptional regulator [bacterium]HQJ66143.1 helix-turn-helix transcriptional regulator [bacterium]
MTLNTLDLVLFLAASQAAFLGILILHKYPGLPANRILGIMMLLYAVIVGHNLAVELGYFSRFPHLLLVPLGFTLLVAPLHYFYARMLTHPEARFRRRDALHAIPALLYWLAILPDFAESTQELNARLSIAAETMSPRFLIFNLVLVLQAMVYLGLTMALIRRFHQRLRLMFASLERLKLTWLQQITFLLISAWMIFALEEFLLMLGINLTSFDLSSLLIGVYIYLMGYMALLKSEIFSQPALTEPMHLLESMDAEEALAKSNRYEKSGLSPERAQDLTRILLAVMDEKEPYTNNELTLADLAEVVQITPHNLSEILNTHLQKNFYDFINQYRIEKAKRDLADPAKRHLKILALAYDAGFNSKTAFNTLFKQSTHMTPSEYRARFLPQAI